MKKFYFLLVSLVLMVTTANAQISSITDVFGRYRFTADLEVIDNNYKSAFSDDCEVTLTQSDVAYYPAMLLGFGGATGVMYIAEFNEEAQAGIVRNPNNEQFGTILHMAYLEGNYPYNNDEYNYSEVYLTYDAATKSLTYPDFSIVTVNHPESSATIVAKFTNVKLELIELENVVYPDLTGEWKYAGSLRNEKLSPKGFTMNLTAVDENFQNWTAKLAFEGYEENVIELPATFDGIQLTIPFDNVYISEKDSIRFGLRSSGTGKSGEIVLSYASKTAMQFYSYFYVRKDTMKWDEDAQDYKLAGAIRQVFTDYMEREDPDARDWTGTYTVAVAEDDKVVMDEEIEMPSEFDIVIEKVPGGYAVTEMLGYRMADSNMSSLSFVPDEGDETAEIKISSWGSYLTLWKDSEYIENVDCYVYYEITDLDGGTNPISVTVNEDGTMTLGSFMISKKIYNSETYEWIYNEPVVAYNAATMSVKRFNWVGTHTITMAEVVAYDGKEYPNSFDVEVIYDDANKKYLVTKVFGTDITALNYGGISLTVSEDGNSAEFKAGGYIAGKYPDYLIINDAEGKNGVINLVVKNDGTISMDSFLIQALNYTTNTTTDAALYKNAETAIEDVVVENNAVEGIYDMQGRQVKEITAPGLYIVNGKKVLVK